MVTGERILKQEPVVGGVVAGNGEREIHHPTEHIAADKNLSQ